MTLTTKPNQTKTRGTLKPMIDRMLHNWKPKLASLLVAVAVWYLFKENIRRQDQGPIISDPGVLSASVSTSADSAGTGGAGGIPGIATLLASIDGSSPTSTMVADRTQRKLVRLRWIELGAFRTSVAEFPGLNCG